MRKLLYIFLLASAFPCLIAAQDPIFSQYYAMPLQINPAFTGSAFAPRVGIAYRNQWTGFNNAYRTYGVFYEQQIERLNSGFGVSIEGDNAGDGIFRTNRFAALYSYQLNISKALAVKIGVEAGVIQTTLDWEKLIFPDQLDPLGGLGLPTGEIRPDFANKTVLDLSTGLLVVGENLWFGGALKHLNTPDEGILIADDQIARGLPLRYTLHGGANILVKKSNKGKSASFISPNFLLVSQGPFRQLNVGAYAGFGMFYGGTWFRHTFSNADAVILLAGFKQGVFKIGLSYDLTVSRLASYSGGTYELTMGLSFDQNERLRQRRKRAQINDCLGMFR